MNKRRLWETLRPYVMIGPAMIGILLFVIYPVLYLAKLSLYKYNLLNKAKSKFVGLDNFQEIFSRGDFYKALLNTVVYTVGVVTLTIALSLLIAVWVKNKTRLNTIVQAGIFTPHIISIVSVALVWMWIMEPSHGVLNFILRSLGLPGLSWLQSSSTSLLSVIIVSVWQGIGYYTLIIVAALHGVNPQIYEAAELDSANKFQTFFRITLPLISPQLFFVLIIMTIGSFKVFDTVKIMTGGGPNGSTTTLVYYIYEFRTNSIGYASATGVVLMAIIAVLTFVYFRILSKRVHYQ
ncbi:sn-glycerol 3-phosphate transport system permease protein [Paenibacillus sp. UNCCL117]|uniref:carbohydrate ABC transporter permease n=1 Tax=unclassified Paenibacillus TaxID=185978 RepID=UPI00087E14D5|nr:MULTISPECIES: sugar ABC transporter permease [unclassified Paenibacillus]SDD12245.1 carbohydrate ABC transporter membrane protein 1, CUT1 family [Paenibacillus sp. cl123]SFW33754.1 sn-glycerol 3-phosphate transport system permease protein [Paenibacillus sp. UNCCL117]